MPQPYLDQINEARRVYRESPGRKSDWCLYLSVTQRLRKEFNR